jgi:hypothetical protein
MGNESSANKEKTSSKEYQNGNTIQEQQKCEPSEYFNSNETGGQIKAKCAKNKLSLNQITIADSTWSIATLNLVFNHTPDCASSTSLAV